MKKVIGIDLGTTNSVVAFKTKDVEVLRNKEGDELTRSCVALRNDQILVGRHAYNNLKSNPQNTILSVKRLMGGAIKDKMVQDMISNKEYYQFNITALKGGTDDSVAVILGGKQYTPDQISSEILKKLKTDAEEKLNDEVTHAVITVPAYFTPKQKNATLLAAHYAGLKVSKLLSEPTAAAIAYGVDNVKLGEAKTVLVYDFGGGTFDLSILIIADGQYSEFATGGDRWLGGDDIDKALYKHILRKVAAQYNIAELETLIENLPERKKYQFKFEMREKTEQAKIQLSSTNKSNIDIYGVLEDENGDIIDIDISRKEFEDLIKPLIQKSIDLIESLLKEVNYQIEMIDNIILVGGTSCIPLVKEMLVAKYGNEKTLVSKKPMLTIAEGAAILAHRLDDSYEAPIIPVGVIDSIAYTTNHTYFIKYQVSEGKFDFKKIIDKQMPLPISKTEVFKTTSNNQRIAKLEIWAEVEEGEKEKQHIAFLKIDDNLPIQSEIVFELKVGVDEEGTNETFSIDAYPRSRQAAKKKMIIDSGQFDAKALRTIDEHLQKVSDEVGKWSLQEKFYSYAGEMLDLAYEVGNNNPLSEKWHEVDFKIKDKFDSVVVENNNPADDRSYIAAMSVVLVSEYRDFINPITAQRLIQLLQQYEAAIDFEKEQFLDEMDRINDNNSDFFIFHKLKLAAERAPDKPTPNIGNTEKVQDIQTLNRNHTTILNHYKNNRTDEAMNLLVESMPIVQKYL